jgi:IclR family transcriptional regulator, pca regulon regulatory protein
MNRKTKQQAPPQVDRDFIQSFARGLEVFEAFHNVSRPQTVSDLSRKTGVSRPAVRRILHTLHELGYAKVEGDGSVLTQKSLRLAHAYLSSTPLAILAQPIVHSLSIRCACFSALLVEDDDQAMLLATSYISQKIKANPFAPSVGAGAPLHASAAGLVILSHKSKLEFATYSTRAKLQPFTYLTQTDPAKLASQLPKILKQGYAIADRTLTIGNRAIAVPVRRVTGQLAGVLTVNAMVEKTTLQQLEFEYLPYIRDAALELESKL